MLPQTGAARNPILVVRSKTTPATLVRSLRRAGFEVHESESLPSAPASHPVVISAGEAHGLGAIEVLAALHAGRQPVVAIDLPAERIADAIALGADEAVVRGARADEIAARVRLAIDSFHAPRGSQLSRGELEALLQITEAATSHLELDELLRVVVDRIARVVPSDRCSALLMEDEDHALVMASHDVPDLRRLRISVDRYPEVRQAVESREPVVIDDLHTDPRMAEVRELVSSLPVSSLVVAPLVAQGDAYGALLLRLARNRVFGEREQAFVRAAASAVANSVRNARLHTSVRRKRDELEAAYHQRYRELVHLNEQLRETNRIKDELLAIVSHDLRSPLNTLLGHAQLLAGADLPAPQLRSVQAIDRQGQRLLELVQQILERGRHRGQAAGSAPVDLGAMARTLAGDTLTDRGNRVIAVGEESAVVEGDASSLRQVLENLVGNAISHSPDGATVELDVRLAGNADHVRVEVRDRGPGIPEEELPLVFERYRKGDQSSGLGLGLAICREIVEQHGGSIWADAREGGGSVFVFTVPTRPGVGRGAPVLALCSDPVLAEAVESILGSDRVAIARSIEEGTRQATLLLPDAILIESRIGEAAEALRALPGLGEVPVIFLGEAQGAYRSLPVPLDRVALEEALAAALPAPA